MELREYAAIIWRWLWLICLGTLLAGGTAFIVSQRMTPIYQASTTLLINQARNPGTPNYQDILTSERIARTYAELLTRRPVLEETASRLGMLMEEGKLADAELDVKPVRDTLLIELKVESPSPRLAADVANTLPQVFIEQNEAIQSARFASSKANLSRELEALSQEIEKTQATINALEKEADTPEKQAEMTRLQSTLTQYQSTYANLLQSYENLRLAEAQSIDTITVIEPARVPERPIRPRVKLNTLLAAIVGAMLATGVAFLIEYLDDTIKSPDELRNLLGIAWLGSVARIPGASSKERLIAASEPRHPIVEAFRTLRTNLQFSAVDRPLKSLVVTSANPEEGKTTTAANLAVVMAQAGLSVVLVDADLRRPRLHEVFEVSNSQGLTDAVLHGNPSPVDYVRETGIPNLRLLTTGKLPPNPAEFLSSQRMQELIEHLKNEADVLIFDSPPVLAVTDAAVLGRQVDGVLLVVDAGRTRLEAALRSVEALQKVKANILGATLNRLSRRSRGYYYYDYYYRAEEEGASTQRRTRHGNGRLRSIWQRLRTARHPADVEG